MQAVPHLCIIPCHSPFKWEKSQTSLSHISQKVPSRRVLGTIHSVELAAVLQATWTGMLTLPTLSVRSRWLGSTQQCLLSCRKKEVPHSLYLSRSSQLEIWRRTQLPNPPDVPGLFGHSCLRRHCWPLWQTPKLYLGFGLRERGFVVGIGHDRHAKLS